MGCPTNIEITTRIATSTMRHLTTIRILAGIVVSRSTTYHKIMVAIAISAVVVTSMMKFMSILQLQIADEMNLGNADDPSVLPPAIAANYPDTARAIGAEL
jgi:hypothetical protein